MRLSVLAIPLICGVLILSGCKCSDNEDDDEIGGYEVETSVDRTYPNMAGTWHWNVEVLAATGPCVSEIGVQPVRTVQITQNGSRLRIKGFLASNPEAYVDGYVFSNNRWNLTASGAYDEDGGRTTTSYNLRFDYDSSQRIPPRQLNGSEYWKWNGAGDSCSGQSKITANRIN